MIFNSRIQLKPLAALCRRLAISLEAGIDVRTIWTREASMARGAVRRQYETVRDSVARGHSLSDSLAETGGYFPDFFRQLFEVGEESGHLPEVCRQMADYYELRVQLRRTLVSSLIRPVAQLAIALGVVGLLIWLMGAIPQLAKQNTDLLGFGLRGNSGLLIYLAILAAVGTLIYLVVRGIARGSAWLAPVQQLVLRFGPIGHAVETLSLARLTAALHVTLNSGMELRKALKLSLLGTQNPRYARSVAGIVRSISSGQEIHEALRAAQVFPASFLDTVQVGEASGSLVRSMQHMAAQYQDESRSAMRLLTSAMGFIVWGLIALVIIFLIFRIFGSYMNMINDALKGR